MAKASKPKKQKPKEQPLKINGTFGDVIVVAMKPKTEKKEEPKKD